ncbi:MAG: TldD/PmbA family protein, partial [Candidatus Omnitrophica bacterium]|nr:TldD/PmbA family protein [Candidatus Omnitrophota bacterium]
MRAILLKIVEAKATAVQARYHRRRRLKIKAENSRVTLLSASETAGVGFRVLQKGIWGFSSTSNTDVDELKKTFEEANQAALSGNGLRQGFPLVVSPVKGVLQVKETRPVTNIPLEEKVDLVRRSEEQIKNLSPKVVSSVAFYEEIVDEKIIVTSGGTNVSYRDVKTDFRVLAYAAEGSRLESGQASVSATGGWGELFRHNPAEMMPELAVKSAVEKLQAEPAPAGLYQVVLHPSLVGILAHEAIGHTVEADFVLAGSIASQNLNQKVASERITLVDDPWPHLDPAATGTLLVDDEGNSPMAAVIINQGYLKGYLHDMETAGIFQVANTGNARAFSYQDEPLIRMRNTYIQPGNDAPEEIIASTALGLYLKGLGQSGQADANAEFMFGVDEA